MSEVDRLDRFNITAAIIEINCLEFLNVFCIHLLKVSHQKWIFSFININTYLVAVSWLHLFQILKKFQWMHYNNSPLDDFYRNFESYSVLHSTSGKTVSHFNNIKSQYSTYVPYTFSTTITSVPPQFGT